jgi:hypothetical protein
MRLGRLFLLICFVLLFASQGVFASAFIRGAYYRLGDDDPGAAPGATGNDPTRDSFSDALHLSRIQSPQYSADVPAAGPAPNKLSMLFVQQSVNASGRYQRASSLSMIEQGYALEAWVKRGFEINCADCRDPITQLIAYNGDPTANGFGFYRLDSDYIVRIGAFERRLGPAESDVWHHLAYVQTLGTSSYYYDGLLVAQTNGDPLPTTASGGFWLAGRSTSTGAADLFNGWIDEVRYQSFNPLAAGAFKPTNFLISVPEPSSGLAGLISASLLALLRRRPARML